MTLEKLKQLRHIRKLIEMERARVEDLRESLDPRSPIISGMPKQPGAHDKIGETVPVILDGEQGICDLLQQLEREEAEISDWISSAPPDIQVICRLKFIENQSWIDVAATLDTGNGRTTDCSVKSLLYRYLKRWNIEHPEE